MSARGVAIVGMACVLPGARDLDAYWRNLRAGVDAIGDVPPSRWESVFYDPDSSAPDRVYCRRGGFVDDYAEVDALAFGVMPATAAGAEPDQLLALQLAADALADAGYADGGFARERTSVILGRGGYIGAGVGRLEQHVRTAQQLVECLRGLLPDLPEAELDAVKADFQARLGAYGPDTAIGLVPNLAASRIANRLDLGGAAYTVDAACASSLVAVDHACRDLRSGRADLVLAGGVHVAQDISFWSVFSQLGALSRSQQIRPFDRRADGLLIGEGLGIVALKRVEDAERDGDRVYAVVRGTGVASDGRGATVMTPSVDGQLLALARAWEEAGLEPETVGLLEAHGTATAAGDAAELETLARFFGPPNGHRAGLGSVKSMIGHTMPAAGAAGLIKAALAVHHGVLLPTLHCEEPHDAVERTRFRIVAEAEPWEEDERRAGVNAFGFGGINAHVVLERHAPAPGRRRRPPASARAETMLVLAADTKDDLLARLERGAGEPGTGRWRLAVADPTPDRLARARAAVEAGAPRHGRDGIFFSASGLVTEGGRVAFLFPGVEATFEPRVDDVAAHFGLTLPGGGGMDELEDRAFAVLSVSRLLHRVLRELGVRADVVAGHSLGEWTGMIASGMIADEDVDEQIAALVPGTLEIPGVVYAAVGCSAEQAAAALAGLGDTVVSHDNCPHQTVLSGPLEEVEEALARLRRERVLGEVLPFPRGGCHSPLFASYLGPYRETSAALALARPTVPLWSATTCRPYPDDPDAIRELHARHLVEPVRFRELVLALHDEGVRVFVQVGTGNLVGFVDDVLRGRPHHAIAVNVPQRSGLDQLRRAAAALFVEGASVRLDRLGLGGAPRARLPLALGVPLVRLDRPLDVGPAGPTPVGADDAVGAEFSAALRELRAAEAEVVRALGERAKPRARVQHLVERRRLSVADEPALLDHSFFRQPAGWPTVADRGPVVPLTMSLDLIRDAASRAAGGRPVARVEHVRAYRWLAVEPAVDVTITVSPLGGDRARVTLDGYAEAVAVLADALPPPPAPDPAPLAEERKPAITAEELYRGRWMFHGPAYQGVASIDALGRDGVRGTLLALPAPGALLDAAGQLFGYWLMATSERDRMAMPVKLERIEFYGPDPTPGTTVDCAVSVRRAGRQTIVGDVELAAGGRVWARVTGWEDRRFDIDERFWSTIQFPDERLFGDVHPDGYVVVRDDGRSDWAWDYLERRYLSVGERAALGDGPRRRKRLLGRIAAKDAVRALLWERGRRPIYPVEIEIRADEGGRPSVHGRLVAGVRVSIAHTDGVAVALAADEREPGIDVERIEPRGKGFTTIAFAPAELALVPADASDEWVTRLWCAKEAVAKARGTGLGSPRSLAAEAVDGERVRVDGQWVETRSADGRVTAWTQGGA